MKSIDTTLLWLQTAFFAVIIYWLGLGYQVLYRGFIIASMSEALALCGGILIGLSFALSGLGYFFNIFDSAVKYRKMLGIIGYFFAFIYSVSLALRFPEKYIDTFPQMLIKPEVILGLTAMSIFSFMTIISTQWAIKHLGKNWRPLLRLGYVAFICLSIRAALIEGTMWLNWMNTLKTVPPPRLVLTLFAGGVILLRIALEVALRIKKSSVPVVTQSTG